MLVQSEHCCFLSLGTDLLLSLLVEFRFQVLFAGGIETQKLNIEYDLLEILNLFNDCKH